MDKGLLLVVSAPSGGGKGTVLKEVLSQDSRMRFSVSATTRAPRTGEEHGKQYYFISKDEFRNLVDTGKMLEFTEYCGNFYGTPKEPVEEWTRQGFDVVLEIEVDGGGQIKKLMPDCVSVFLLPPSMRVLEQRLRSRGTEDEETILRRLETARREIPCAKEYDYVIVNDRLEDAAADLLAIVRAEKRKYSRNQTITERVLQDA